MIDASSAPLRPLNKKINVQTALSFAETALMDLVVLNAVEVLIYKTANVLRFAEMAENLF